MKTPNQIHYTSRSSSTRSFRQATLITLFLVVGSGLFNFRAAANQVLLFYDAGYLLGPSRYEAALNNRGYPYTVFTDESSFIQAVQTADPASDVVVVDSIVSFHNFSSVTAFVQSGGRALLQYWNLAGESALASALQVSATPEPSGPTPISPRDWGGSDLFTGTSSPLILTTVATYDYVHGQKLEPAAGGQAVAGFVNSPTANEAALVIGNSGHTVVQGFYIEEIELIEEALQFAQSELDFLLGPIAPPSGPWIISSPQPQTILAGFGTTLRVHAGGSLPLTYQWQQDGTNILGATNAFYPITNAQFQQTGAYSVIVSNVYYATPSGPALLTVTKPAPIGNILLLVDDGTFPSPYENALVDLGLSYQKYSDQSGFNSAVALADPVNTLVILDAYHNPFRYSELVGFVKAGGRVLLQIWNLTAGTHLAEAFNVAVVEWNTTALPVHDWGGSDFFAGVVTPLALASLSTDDYLHGQKLQPLAGAQAVAGFISNPTANEAAIVIGNAGHTIVNGFMLEEAVSSAEATQVARNQILHFFPLRFESTSLSGSTLTLRWTAIPSQDYQVQYKETPADPSWKDLGPAITAFDATASTTDTITAADQRIYRVLLLP